MHPLLEPKPLAPAYRQGVCFRLTFGEYSWRASRSRVFLAGMLVPQMGIQNATTYVSYRHRHEYYIPGTWYMLGAQHDM